MPLMLSWCGFHGADRLIDQEGASTPHQKTGREEHI